MDIQKRAKNPYRHRVELIPTTSSSIECQPHTLNSLAFEESVSNADRRGVNAIMALNFLLVLDRNGFVTYRVPSFVSKPPLAVLAVRGALSSITSKTAFFIFALKRNMIVTTVQQRWDCDDL